jgi:hypothetical protein
MKRSKAEWGFEKLLKKKPAGVKTKTIEASGDMLILKVTFPASFDNEQLRSLETWVAHLKQQLPENVFVTCVTDNIDLEILKPPTPKSIHINVRDTMVTGSKSIWKELMDRVAEFDQQQDLVYIQVDMNGCTLDFQDDEKKEKETIPPMGQPPIASGPSKSSLVSSVTKILGKVPEEELKCPTCGKLPPGNSCPHKCDDYH